jgi:hypothetical protein
VIRDPHVLCAGVELTRERSISFSSALPDLVKAMVAGEFCEIAIL